MEDLSLHILDIVENSINADARNIDIVIREDAKKDVLVIEITDDGRGMDAETVRQVTDPFYTTRTTRRVGLGLPFLDEAAKAANGRLEVQSTPGKGTTIRVTFQLDHIDRKPLGNMAETITTLIAGQPDVDVNYRHVCDGQSLSFSTQEVKRQLDGVPINSIESLTFLRQYLTEEENRLRHQA